MIVIYAPPAEEPRAIRIPGGVNVAEEAGWFCKVQKFEGDGPSACVWIVPGTENRS